MKPSAAIPKTYSHPVVLADPSAYVPEPATFLDHKEALQKQLESQQYNPFGKAGGGAPNARKSAQNQAGNHA